MYVRTSKFCILNLTKKCNKKSTNPKRNSKPEAQKVDVKITFWDITDNTTNPFLQNFKELFHAIEPWRVHPHTNLCVSWVYVSGIHESCIHGVFVSACFKFLISSTNSLLRVFVASTRMHRALIEICVNTTAK